MPASLEIYDTSLSSAVPNINSLGDFEPGNTVSIYSCKIRNDGDATATNIRLFARCVNGLYTGQINEVGQEAITEQWVEVDTGSGYTAIGGNFAGGGTPSPAGNYVTLSNLTAGSSTGTISFRLVIPASISSYGQIRFEIGVSCNEN